MILKSTDVDKALKKKMKATVENTSHKEYTVPKISGEGVAGITHMSHKGKHDLDDFLIGKMADDLNLSKSQFIKMVNCTLDREQALDLMDTLD